MLITTYFNLIIKFFKNTNIKYLLFFFLTFVNTNCFILLMIIIKDFY